MPVTRFGGDSPIGKTSCTCATSRCLTKQSSEVDQTDIELGDARMGGHGPVVNTPTHAGETTLTGFPELILNPGNEGDSGSVGEGCVGEISYNSVDENFSRCDQTVPLPLHEV